MAFVLWYTAVARLGADRAGLFTGVVPVTAAVGGVLLGAPAPAPVVWAGMALVAVGLGVGLSARVGTFAGASRPFRAVKVPTRAGERADSRSRVGGRQPWCG